MKFIHPRMIRVLFEQNKVVYQIPLHFLPEQFVWKAVVHDKKTPQQQSAGLPFDVSVSEGYANLSLKVPQGVSTQDISCGGQTTQTKMQ